MNCHYCGTEVSGKEKFCPFCGTKVERAEAPLPVQEDDFLQNFLQEPEAPVLEYPGLPMPAPEEEPVASKAPELQLPTGRALWKMVLFGILTLGIYPTVIWSRLTAELNIAASRYDGQRTTSYFGMALLGVPTLGIYPLVWYDGLCRRIGDELDRRGVGAPFGPRDFWLWNVLGSLILAGPFVFLHKLMKAMNQINEDFNCNG